MPTNFYFPFGKNIKTIPLNHLNAPWGEEMEHEILTVKPSRIGTYAETAFFHKSTQSLLVTDIIVKVSDAPDAIINDDPRALLYHARDSMLEEINDTPSNRLKGWRRMVTANKLLILKKFTLSRSHSFTHSFVHLLIHSLTQVLFALTFNPSGITVSDFLTVLKDINKVSPAMKLLGMTPFITTHLCT